MNIDSLGERMRESRKALQLSQDDVASRCGVSREMWGKYERGAAIPGGEVLAAMAAAGFDIVYVLTGARTLPVSERATLSMRQRALLDNYEHTDEPGKRVIESTASLAAQSRGKRA